MHTKAPEQFQGDEGARQHRHESEGGQDLLAGRCSQNASSTKLFIERIAS